MVYVISKTNEPLMPCSNVIARLLLKQGKAKVKRKEPFTIQLGIEKEHYYDACVIATDGKLFKIVSNLYKKKCVSCGDFEQTKGVRSEQPIITDKICGFRKFDKVKYFGKEYFINGRMSSGYAVLMDINGNKIDFSSMPKGFKTPKMVNLKRLVARSSWIVTTVADIQNIA